ncbi:hypothetical protein [Roseovarius sp. Pro17]|nr:hypothetical protein [Roseovarius sp. Pro17]
MPPEFATRTPWGVDGSIADLTVVECSNVNTYRDALTEAWHRLAAGN